MILPAAIFRVVMDRMVVEAERLERVEMGVGQCAGGGTEDFADCERREVPQRDNPMGFGVECAAGRIVGLHTGSWTRTRLAVNALRMSFGRGRAPAPRYPP